MLAFSYHTKIQLTAFWKSQVTMFLLKSFIPFFWLSFCAVTESSVAHNFEKEKEYKIIAEQWNHWKYFYDKQYPEKEKELGSLAVWFLNFKQVETSILYVDFFLKNPLLFKVNFLQIAENI